MSMANPNLTKELYIQLLKSPPKARLGITKALYDKCSNNILSPLWGKYIKIVNKSNELLGDSWQLDINQESLPKFWTNHGSNHAFSVYSKIDNLFKMFGDEWQLEAYEIFILLSACWCHDFGMAYFDPSFSSEKQRKYHGRISGQVLNALCNQSNPSIPLTPEELLAINIVCAAHQSNVNLSDIKNIITISLDKIEYPIRVDLLGAILRIADALDISRNRARMDFWHFFENLCGMPESPSVFEWNVNYCVKRNHIDTTNGVFKFNLEMNKDLSEHLTHYKKPHKVHNTYRRKFKHELYRFLEKQGKYIEYYITDHILSIMHNTNDQRNIDYFIASMRDKSIQINLPRRITTRSTTRQIDAIISDRDTHWKIMNKGVKQYHWMATANSDFQILQKMGHIREDVKSEAKDIFMFLLDRESDALSLWCPPGDFYSKYVNETANTDANSITVDKKDFLSRLRKARIPMKCGIVGYVAWMGDDEDIEDEQLDPRASYSDLDKLLGLKNVKFWPFIENNTFLGVFLINLSDTTTSMDGDKAKSKIISEFPSLVDLLKKHCAK